MQRDITLDSFRGLFLAVMMIDHLALPLSNYTVHFLGFISAAECFVFLSGYIAGIVYTKIRVTYGRSQLWQAALQRAQAIYLGHIIVFLLIMITGFYNDFFVSAWKSNIFNFSDPLILNNPLLALVLGAVLLYQPTFLDILPLYFIFLLLMPLLLERFVKGHSLVVILSSISIWLIAQFGVLTLFTNLVGTHLPIFLGAFDILAWQIIFVFGLYFGFLKYQRTELSMLLENKLLIGSLLIAIICFLLRHNIIEIGLNEAIISKERLGLLKLINFASIIYLVAAIRSRFDRFFQWRWLSELGQHSLQVYAFHVGLIFMLAPISLQIKTLPKLMEIFVTLVAVLSLAIPVKLHQIYRNYHSFIKEDSICSTKA